MSKLKKNLKNRKKKDPSDVLDKVSKKTGIKAKDLASKIKVPESPAQSLIRRAKNELSVDAVTSGLDFAIEGRKEKAKNSKLSKKEKKDKKAYQQAETDKYIKMNEAKKRAKERRKK